MNCQRARQLVTPYLDQQMTGSEMLEMQGHLAGCPACAQEYQEARQTKILLRSLELPHTDISLEKRILCRLAEEDRRPNAPFSLMMPYTLPAISPFVSEHLTMPKRGRRLTGALLLSCFVILGVAGPFSPGTIDFVSGIEVPKSTLAANSVFDHSSVFNAQPPVSAMASFRRDAVPEGVFVATGQTPTMLPASNGASLPMAEPGATPLDDEAAGDYASGDVAMADYRE